jgi:hypothetical protein
MIDCLIFCGGNSTVQGFAPVLNITTHSYKEHFAAASLYQLARPLDFVAFAKALETAFSQQHVSVEQIADFFVYFWDPNAQELFLCMFVQEHFR